MFRLQDDETYNMPAHFGGDKSDPAFKPTAAATALTISYETDRAQLENYIPEEFELRAPEVHVMFKQLTEVNWMLGGSYNLIGVTAPVRFHGKRDQLDGVYPLVFWENKTEPILTGRERDGVPKIYADIEDLHIWKPYYGTTASWGGYAFLTMSFEATGPITGQELDRITSQSASMDFLGWRYIPKVGAPGAELSQFVLFPHSMEVEVAQQGTGSLSWMEQTIVQNPTQYRIINSLASLPIVQITQAVLTKGLYVLHTWSSRVIE
jgi:acetoacetate decarboxylase